MVKRVWDAAKLSWADKVVVAWPERYPDLDENDVLGRFRRVSQEYPSHYIIRLTADCPLITHAHINEAIRVFTHSKGDYYNNHRDGFDVQIFRTDFLYGKYTHKEHVVDDIPNTGGLSVNTKSDLERVRSYAR